MRRQQQLDSIVRRKNTGGKKKKQKETVQKMRQGVAASKAMDLPAQPLVKTIPGGTSVLFAMARSMAVSAPGQEEDYGTWTSASDAATGSSIQQNRKNPKRAAGTTEYGC